MTSLNSTSLASKVKSHINDKTKGALHSAPFVLFINEYIGVRLTLNLPGVAHARHLMRLGVSTSPQQGLLPFGNLYQTKHLG
jgi:hypothetical protein